MLEWMRMFDQTAFYIKLIWQTVSDIKPFLALFSIFLISFGCAMICLGLNRTQDDEQIVTSYVGWWLIDSIINQYLLSLGEFGPFDEAFEGKQQTLCYVFFLLSTFFTQITALNMIIAIMSQTYDDVMSVHEQHSRE